MKQSIFLHTPPGTRPFFKEEAIFRHSVEKKLKSFFESWSFFPIEPPMIDYFEAYSRFLSEEQKRGAIRFINRDGNLVLLRNDLTLFAAKFIASRSNPTEEILRYYYSDSIIRCQEKDAPEEYYQIGCEIISENFTYQEIELLCILLESLKLLEIPDFYLFIGDISFYQNLLTGICSEDFIQIISLVKLKDINQLNKYLNKLDLEPVIKQDCLLAAEFIGPLEELKKVAFSDRGKSALLNLFYVTNILFELGYKKEIIINLAELPNLDYYNGIIFHVYSKGVESPLATGGRYDLLLHHLGLKKNAIGFSYWLYPLEKILNKKTELYQQESQSILIQDQPVQQFKDAIQLIKNKKTITIQY